MIGEGMKEKIKKLFYVFVYIFCMFINILFANRNRTDFMLTYANNAFSKGLVGILLCNGVNIILAIILTMALIYLLRH